MATLRTLEDLLLHTPVISELHPLLPLCLEPGIRLVDDADEYIGELDDLPLCKDEKVIVTKKHPLLMKRFPFIKIDDPPSTEEINKNMHRNLEYARKKLLNNHTVADFVEEEIRQHPCDIVILLLVDGLSYEDVRLWDTYIQPCFIDGPSITFFEDEAKQINEKVGFPAIVNNPTLFVRLQNQGFRAARGFTYWSAETNTTSDLIFRGIPTNRIEDFNAVIRRLEKQAFPEKTYIQILRQGLDGLAHHRRELDRGEIQSVVDAIFNDANQIIGFFKKKSLKVRLYLTADHGILWKDEHDWQVLNIPRCHHRYAERALTQQEKEYTERISCADFNYALFRYPYLASKISADACGVHGGLSYQESVVPLVRMEA